MCILYTNSYKYVTVTNIYAKVYVDDVKVDAVVNYERQTAASWKPLKCAGNGLLNLILS